MRIGSRFRSSLTVRDCLATPDSKIRCMDTRAFERGFRDVGTQESATTLASSLLSLNQHDVFEPEGRIRIILTSL